MSDAIISRTGLGSRVGMKYATGGEIFNDYLTNKALGRFSAVFGTTNIAGARTFKILSVDVDNKAMVLSSVEGLVEGLECSCQYDNNYELFGIITSINTENNTVVFNNIPPDTFPESGTNVLWIPSNPELGETITILGSGAVVGGWENKANSTGSVAFGYNNIAIGKYSFVAGYSNNAGYSSSVFGQFNKVNQWSFGAGYNNTTKDQFTFVCGYGNTVSAMYGSSFGHNNTISGKAGVGFGENNTASGPSSFVGGTNSTSTNTSTLAFGNKANASGKYSTSIGFMTSATADGSVVLGWGAKSTHEYAVVLGVNLDSTNQSQLVCGKWNILEKEAGIDYAFVVGNGTSATARSNAFSVNKNGQALLGNTSVLNNDKAVPSKKYVDDLYQSAISGSSFGHNNTISGKAGVGFGENNTGSGACSFVGGTNSTSTNTSTFAFGNKANATAKYAIAMGFTPSATADGSVALGWGAKSVHDYSVVLGVNVESSNASEFVCGKWNILEKEAGIDYAFVVGNGTSATARSNAFSVNKNGQALLGNTSVLNNDKAVPSKKYVDDLYQSAISGKLVKQIVTSVDTTNNKVTINGIKQNAVENTIYLLKDDTAQGDDLYKEYTLIGTPAKLTMIGDTSVSLQYVDDTVNYVSSLKDYITCDNGYLKIDGKSKVSIYAPSEFFISSSIAVDISANSQVNINSVEVNIDSFEKTVIKNVVDPINDKDAANKAYVDRNNILGTSLANNSVIVKNADNISGTKSFTITAISTNESNQVVVTLDSVEGIEVGQECRFKTNSEYYSEVLEINGNNVTLNALNSSAYNLELYTANTSKGEYTDSKNPYLIRSADGTDTEKNSLFIIGHPEIGTDRILGTNAASFGSYNNASSLNTFIAGSENNALGGFSAVFGKTNSAAYCGIVGGRNNDARLSEYGATFGYGNIYTGQSNYAFAAGGQNELNGAYTVALGGKNKINGVGSSALGIANEINGNYSSAFGYYNKTNSNYQVAVGTYNELIVDALFMVGNGTKDARSNAFVVQKDGDVLIPRTATIYGSLNLSGPMTASGKINANKGIVSTVYSGVNNTIVLNTDANEATGKYSIAGGINSKAIGVYSTALGYYTVADKVATFVAGANNTSNANYQTIFGSFANNSTNSLFTVGNGSSSAKSNAFDVTKNGQAYLGNADIDETKDTSVVTKKYADTKLGKYGESFLKGEEFKIGITNNDLEYSSSTKFNMNYEHIELLSKPTVEIGSWGNIYIDSHGVDIEGNEINIGGNKTGVDGTSDVRINNVVDPTNDRDAVNKKYVDGTDSTINLNYTDFSGSENTVLCNYTTKGNTIELRGTIDIDISDNDSYRSDLVVTLPEVAKYDGISLGNAYVELGTQSDGEWRVYSIGVPYISGNELRFIAQGLKDSYRTIFLDGNHLQCLTEETEIKSVRVGFIVSYDKSSD